jgi:CHAT domain-containing protein
VYAGFHVSDNALSIFVARKNRSEILQERIPIRDVRSVIDVLQETILRGKLSPSDEYWKGSAQFLHTLLIHPLVERGLLHAGDHLIISPHRSLHLVPFAALLSQDGISLVDSVTISYAPSATQLVKSMQNPISSPASILAFAPDDASLPFVREEIAAIPENVFHSVVSLSNADATTGNLFKEWSYAGAIHIASHGSVNLLYPLYSTITCSDRSLELHEILRAKFQARFVLLSACETGRTVGASGKIPDGHDMVSFPRAFITAGAASVISPLWLVEDKSTAKLVALFYDELARRTIRGASPDWSEPNQLANSLNEAQRKFKSQPATSHPFYWAAFTLTGSP